MFLRRGFFLFGLRRIKTGDRQKCSHDWALIDRVNEMRVERGNFVHFAAEKFFNAKFRDRFRFDKTRRVFQFEIGQHFAARP